MTTATAVPASVDVGDLVRRVVAAFLEEWHLAAPEDVVTQQVVSTIMNGQASAEYAHGSGLKQIWLVAEGPGVKAGVGKAPDRLRAEIVVRWSETEPTADEVVTYTTAPSDYDWFGTRTLKVVGRDRRGKEIRKVAGPPSHLDAQRGRYGSGNHLAVDEAEWRKLVDFKLVELVS